MLRIHDDDASRHIRLNNKGTARASTAVPSLLIRALLVITAGYGSRTRLLGLGSRCTTDVLRLHEQKIL